MLTLFVFVLILFVFARQFTGPRPLRWARRVHRLRPLFKWLKADAKAVVLTFRSWRAAMKFRRQLRRT